MKFSHLTAIIFACTTIGISMPAHAEDVVSNDSVQTAVITGRNNTINQSNNSSIRSSARGGEKNVTSVRNVQSADVAGQRNILNQSNQVEIRGQERGK
ncbi:hypothetical protein [Chamaesiphon sp. VAR_48_metabat_403]|uniref:hypothetical protein n=1 Tax=Chamaesiphon sp. VAR_48_metabat_403 TaxID=2964700 RepID=UPI00286E1FB7|nr:hypothetical protein [Chamaesiphon sp. VAR_48_metabat_403]